jgi:subtilisin family serine protease
MFFRSAPILTLTLIIAATAAPAAAGLPGDEWQAKVDPWVLDSGRSQATEFLVALDEQADLSAADGLPGKEAKGAYVFRTLTEVAKRTQTAVLADLSSRGVEHRAYWIANMIWVRGGIDTVQAMAERNDVAHIYANPAVRVDELPRLPGDDPESPENVEWNIALVNADDVWSLGITGSGAVVAGQDTGYLWSHPALVNQYRGGPGDHDYNWHDAIHSGGGSCGPDSPFPCDDHGHGTHTMGTMVGDDGLGNQVGMAPTAQWIGCRNMDQGVGTPATYAECYQFFIAPTDLNNLNPDPSKAPDVINNSWGCPPSEGCTDPNVLLTVVQNVRAAGIVTVHSAGNDGSGCSSVTTPSAIYDESFSVGATNSSDGIASFSSRGPVTIDGSNRRKPDISAPGVNIRSSTRDGGYQGGWDGTSMAGPHVAGLVGLLISGNPGLAGNVDLIEEIIAATAVPRFTTEGCGGDPSNAVPNNTYGWGRIDAWAANRYPFTLTALPSVRSVCAPADAVFDLTLEPDAGFSEAVTVSTTGIPAGASAAFSVNPVTPPGSSQLTISGTGSVAVGSHPITVVGTPASNPVSHTVTVTMNVSSQAAGGVSLTAPGSGAVNQPLRPSFVWTSAAQAATYDLQVATDATFSNLVLDRTGILSTTSMPAADLPSNTQFFWRVRATNGCGAGVWSPTFDFATVALPGDCGLGTAPAVRFADDFESGGPGWTHSGPGDSWALSAARVHSGAQSFHANDPSTTSDQRLVSPAVVLPATGSALTLQFWNWQTMESSFSGCWDGGVVEISTDDGSTWTPLPTSVLLTDPYDGQVTGLAGLDGWCGDPQDWLNSVAEIDAYAGQTARFRFRLGSDSSVSREGWYIDDVKVQSCVPSEPPLFGDGFETGHTGAWSLTVP